jgi:hypothetical protein
MNINWQEIKEKYPKAINILMEWIHKRNQDYTNKVIINFKELCYCDLEKFFKDNDIEINIMKLYIDGEYVINIFTCDGINNDFRKYKKDDKAKEQAIYKAFEILEQQLKD